MNEKINNTENRAVSTAERIGLPVGFVTEKGSRYQYNRDGSVHRDKFDGTESDAGIAVFIEDNSDNLEVLTRLGVVQNHLPPRQQKRGYILQVFDNEDGTTTAEKIFKAKDIKDPSRLAFALINPLNEVHGWIHVSATPDIGSYVYEMDKTDDGKTVRHPGHRVSDIIY